MGVWRAGSTSLLGFLLLAGCQTDGSGRLIAPAQTTSAAPAPREYTVFFDPGDHFEELVAAGRFVEAAAVYEAQKGWFDEKRAVRYWPQLSAVAGALNNEAEPKLRAARAGLQSSTVRPEGWATVRDARRQAVAAGDEYERSSLLKRKEFRHPEADELKRELSQSADTYRSAASAAFASFDHFGGESFFVV